MKYCAHCGEMMQDDARFCSKCGTECGNGPRKEEPSVNIVKIVCILATILLVVVILKVAGVFNKRTPENAETADTEQMQIVDDSQYIEPSVEDVTMEETVTETIWESSVTEASQTQYDKYDPLLYFIENCDKKYFKMEDVEDFDEWTSILARNACYAKSGRKFTDYRVQEYFDQFDWYEPRIDASAFSDSMLNDYQLANIGLLLEHEGVHGSLLELKVGDTFTFGKYEQDNNPANGKEPIKWIVLEKQDNFILVISKYGLDSQRFHAEEADMTWDGSTIRSWLNSTFMGDAFSDSEKKSIALTWLSADRNPRYDTDPGVNTMDAIFLLSISEAEAYFSGDQARFCKPTEYAVANNAYVDPATGGCWWLMRTPGHIGSYVASTNCNGSIDYDGGRVQSDKGAIRPAMWLAIE